MLTFILSDCQPADIDHCLLVMSDSITCLEFYLRLAQYLCSPQSQSTVSHSRGQSAVVALLSWLTERLQTCSCRLSEISGTWDCMASSSGYWHFPFTLDTFQWVQFISWDWSFWPLVNGWLILQSGRHCGIWEPVFWILKDGILVLVRFFMAK